MTTQFRPLSTYSKVPATTVSGLDRFDPATASVDQWLLPDGCAGRTGRSATPLLEDHVRVLWAAPLGEAGPPTGVLVCGSVIVVEARRRLVVSYLGQVCATFPEGPPAVWLDVSGPRVLADAAEGGLRSYRLPGGSVESSIALSLPSGHLTTAVLPGPDHLLLVVTSKRASSGANDVVAELVRLRSWRRIENGRLYGLDPVAGMIRETDWLAEAALAKAGPVFATSDGVLWCDWRLGPLHEQRWSFRPRALSVDDAGRAFVVANDELGRPHLLLAVPGGAVLASHPLPNAEGFSVQPPLVAKDGSSYMLTPGEIVALSPSGQIAWRHPCGGRPRGSLAANGLLLLADDALYAVDPTGQRALLWTPPSPLVTAPILAGTRVIVASADQLFMLQRDK